MSFTYKKFVQFSLSFSTNKKFIQFLLSFSTNKRFIQFKIRSKNKSLKSSSQSELDKFIPIKHTTKNPHFFDVDETFNEHITNHNNKTDLYLVKIDFISVFDNNFYPHINSELYFKTKFFIWKDLNNIGLNYLMEEDTNVFKFTK